jgi:hypothetical protein
MMPPESITDASRAKKNIRRWLRENRTKINIINDISLLMIID